jgi:hypothetical protein
VDGADSLSEAEAPGKAIPVAAPVAAWPFISPVLDAMFLFDLYVILLGPTFRRLLAYDSPKDGGQGQSPLPESGPTDGRRRLSSAEISQVTVAYISKSPALRLLTNSELVMSLHAHQKLQIFEIGEELSHVPSLC